MAKKAEKPKAAAQEKRKKKAPLFFNTFAGQALLIFISVGAMVFLPTTVLLMVGMLPTIVAFLVSVRGDFARAQCVAAANIVGCFAFVLQLWSMGHNFDNSVKIITDPLSLIIMYGAAGLGYFLDWSLTGMMASVVVQRAKMRMGSIKDRQEALVEKWGAKVTGAMPLDEDGFPIIRE